MDKKLKANINLLLDYMWEDEKRHYEENPSDHHIFVIMKRIREEINDADKPVRE